MTHEGELHEQSFSSHSLSHQSTDIQKCCSFAYPCIFALSLPISFVSRTRPTKQRLYHALHLYIAFPPHQHQQLLYSEIQISYHYFHIAIQRKKGFISVWFTLEIKVKIKGRKITRTHQRIRRLLMANTLPVAIVLNSTWYTCTSGKFCTFCWYGSFIFQQLRGKRALCLCIYVNICFGLKDILPPITYCFVSKKWENENLFVLRFWLIGTSVIPISLCHTTHNNGDGGNEQRVHIKK